MLLRRQLWIFPILAMILLVGLGYFLRHKIQSAMRENVRDQLRTLLDVEVTTLTNWLEGQTAATDAIANDLRVREIVYELLEPPVRSDSSDLSRSQAKLKKELTPRLMAHDFHSYMILGLNGVILAADDPALVGQSEYMNLLDPYLRRIERGKTVVVPPYPSKIIVKDHLGRLRSGVPIMLVLSPLRDATFQPVATLAVRISPDRGFTEILQQARIGDTGETYAFDREGRMISNSRFDEELMLLGLLVDEPGSQSILNIQLRDPGGNLRSGYRPKQRRGDLPLVKPVAEALAGRDGTDVSGYRDYLGVTSVGAWKYLPKYELGILTEIELQEAFSPLAILPYTFWTLLFLLAIAAVAIFVFSVMNSRLQREAQQAVLESKKLGQYQLEEKIGAGGMGIVYRARHAILRRPTAVKMLQPDRLNEAAIERFEREVQMTCQLNHPNTVQIYDYGRTPEGLFYYAMEYLDGIDLQKLVENYGPQPEARVIRILTQVCGSLYEAHSLGLVHRDIKPANMMLNRRGGEPDVAKVLDFGLVKSIDEQSQMTSADSLTGTPLYMPPEAIQTPNSVDARSDLYSLGAVGYFLLTGKPVFDVSNVLDLCQKHVTEVPIPPSQKLGRAISPELEGAILACLEKPRSKRPQTARDLAVMIARAPTAQNWLVDEAELWWSRHDRELSRRNSTASVAAVSPAAMTDHTLQTYVVNE